MRSKIRKAKQIMQIEDFCTLIDEDNFLIKSQTTPDKQYLVSQIGKNFVCECKDFVTSDKNCKHILVAL